MSKKRLAVISITIIIIGTLLSAFTYYNYREMLRVQNEEKNTVLTHFYDEMSLKLSRVVTFTKGLEGLVITDSNFELTQDKLFTYCDTALDPTVNVDGVFVEPIKDSVMNYPISTQGFHQIQLYDIDDNAYILPIESIMKNDATYISNVLHDNNGLLKTVVTIPIHINDQPWGHVTVIADIEGIINGSKSKINEVIGTYRLRNDDVTYIGVENLEDITVQRTIRIGDYQWYLEAYYANTLNDVFSQQHIVTSGAFLAILLAVAVSFNRIFSNNIVLNDQVHNLIYNDMLTNLPNRRALLRDIDQRIENSLPFSVVFLDLDNFKFINDTLGHSQGDIVLKEIAIRLDQMEEISPYRWGGDEFVLLTTQLDEETLDRMLSKVNQELNKAIVLLSDEYRITGSMGTCKFPENGLTREEIIRHADATMYEVKKNGKNHVAFYHDEIGKRVDIGFEVVREMESAIENGEFTVHYQPQYTTASKSMTCLEALVRWQRPDGSYIPPSDFVPIAEESNLVHHIDEFVVIEVIKQIKHWNDVGYDIRVAINVSASHFTKDFMRFLKSELRKGKVPNHAIELEITETAAIKDFDLVKELVTDMRDIGITIALDDFGTGYSSLSALSQISISTLKIDRSFISRIMTEPNVNMIVCAITDIAKALNIRTIAEGVETEEQFDIVKDIGINMIQGYYMSKPLPAHEVEKLFTA